MKSPTTFSFRKAFATLPKQVQNQAREAYRQFKREPNYPSLRFKKVHPELPIYSVRINIDLASETLALLFLPIISNQELVV